MVGKTAVHKKKPAGPGPSSGWNAHQEMKYFVQAGRSSFPAPSSALRDGVESSIGNPRGDLREKLHSESNENLKTY